MFKLIQSRFSTKRNERLTKLRPLTEICEEVMNYTERGKPYAKEVSTPTLSGATSAEFFVPNSATRLPQNMQHVITAVDKVKGWHDFYVLGTLPMGEGGAPSASIGNTGGMDSRRSGDAIKLSIQPKKLTSTSGNMQIGLSRKLAPQQSPSSRGRAKKKNKIGLGANKSTGKKEVETAKK